MKRNVNRYVGGLLIVIIFMAAFALYFYAVKDEGEVSSPREIQVILITKVVDDTNDFWVDLIEGADSAASENKIELTVMGPESEADIEQQNDLIEQAIAMQPNVIVLAPSDYEETIPYAKEIETAGIRLILIDSSMSQTMGSSSVSTDNYGAGYKMGQYMRQYTDEDSVIGIVGHMKGTSTALQREEGLKAGLEEYDENIVDIVYCNSDYDKAYEVTKQMLQEYPSMDMIFGLNEYASVGAARAVKELGLGGQIHMMGFDSSLAEVQLLEEGTFDAIVVQKPFNMGYLGISMAYQAAIDSPDIPAVVDSGSTLITRDNIYTQENEKFLFRFRENEE